jgi:hypothetical protein
MGCGEEGVRSGWTGQCEGSQSCCVEVPGQKSKEARVGVESEVGWERGAGRSGSKELSIK